jgi:hypothetical protein
VKREKVDLIEKDVLADEMKSTEVCMDYDLKIPSRKLKAMMSPGPFRSRRSSYELLWGDVLMALRGQPN